MSKVVKVNPNLLQEAEEIVRMAKSPIGSPLFHSTKDFADFAFRLAIQRYNAEAKIVKIKGSKLEIEKAK